MIDFLYRLGQAAWALIGLPARVKVKGLDPALEDELLLLRHLHNDA